MKNRLLFLLLIALSGLLYQCQTEESRLIEGLPELPEKYAEKLGPSPTSTALTNVLGSWEPTSNTEPPTAQAAGRVRSCNTLYRFSITYPIVHCQVPELYANLSMFLATNEEEKPEDMRYEDATTLVVANYKLSAIDAKYLALPYYCRVDYGPYVAEVQKIEDCNVNVPNIYRFRFDHPINPVYFDWTAFSLEPIPLPDDMQIVSDIIEVSNYRTCCGAKYECRGACIPISQECGDLFPH